MYGAIIGDMVGSPFEFDRGNKSVDFEMFTRRSVFTDDSVMSIAVAEALMEARKDTTIQKAKWLVIDSMQRWGRKYSNAGYGGKFRYWLAEENPKPYGSYGNGSAMRVSSVGWLYDTIDRTREIARATAEVTHNHPEGIKGAESVACAIYMARTGSSKEEIKEYVIAHFHYDFSRSCDDIRPAYHHVESCQETVPEAFTAFFEGNSFEEVIRLAVSLGGDCDTLTCIAGGMAEAYYGVPDHFISECESRLPADMLQVLKKFNEQKVQTDRIMNDSYLDGNDVIEVAINIFYKDSSKDNLVKLLEAIRNRMNNDGHLILPVETPQAAVDMLDLKHIKAGDVVTAKEDLHFRIRQLETKDGRQWLVAFTNQKEMQKGESSSVISNFMDQFLNAVLDMDVAGVILNPWDKFFLLDKELIQIIIDANRQPKPQNHIYFDKGDITKLNCECIVNAANKSLLGGGGVDGAIHRAAGKELLEECRSLHGCRIGEAKITKGYHLKADYIIHTVGPVYSGKKQDEIDLANCYRNSLELAKIHGIHSIAFPAISTGAYGYPLEEAIPIAIYTVTNWFSENADYGMEVIYSCFDQNTYNLYQAFVELLKKGGN